MRTTITTAIVSLLLLVAFLTKSWGMVGYVAGYHDGWNAANESLREPK